MDPLFIIPSAVSNSEFQFRTYLFYDFLSTIAPQLLSFIDFSGVAAISILRSNLITGYLTTAFITLAAAVKVPNDLCSPVMLSEPLRGAGLTLLSGDCEFDFSL